MSLKPTSEILKKRGLDDKGRVQKYIDSEVIRLMTPYTPKDTGELILSANELTEIGSGLIVQGGAKAPYARKWYYTNANFSGTPLRGTYWFDRAVKAGRKSILEGAKREAGIK